MSSKSGVEISKGKKSKQIDRHMGMFVCLTANLTRHCIRLPEFWCYILCICNTAHCRLFIWGIRGSGRRKKEKQYCSCKPKLPRHAGNETKRPNRSFEPATIYTCIFRNSPDLHSGQAPKTFHQGEMNDLALILELTDKGGGHKELSHMLVITHKHTTLLSCQQHCICRSDQLPHDL